MACKACEAVRDKGVYPYRWKNANILVIGCHEHVKEVFNVLRQAQRGGEKPGAQDAPSTPTTLSESADSQTHNE